MIECVRTYFILLRLLLCEGETLRSEMLLAVVHVKKPS